MVVSFESAMPHDYSYPIRLLNDAAEAAVQALRKNPSDGDALKKKRELDEARRILEWARTFALSGHEPSVVVPVGRTPTPSSEFRVVEDNETDDRTLWSELLVGGERLRLYPGDIIVRK
jgi:hypothetical protein